MRFSASSQETCFHSLEPGSRTRGTLVRVSDFTKSSSAAPFGQSVPRFVGMVRVALDVEDLGLFALLDIAAAVHDDAAGNGTVGTGVTGLGG